MSGNAPASLSTKKTDRRVLRSRDTLGDALIELMQEKPFDDITVQQVLDRAGVGRSTFYAHYRDKDDLFLSDVEDFFEMLSTLLTRRKADPYRLAPVAEFFSHIAEMHQFFKAMVASGKANDVMALGKDSSPARSNSGYESRGARWTRRIWPRRRMPCLAHSLRCWTGGSTTG